MPERYLVAQRAPPIAHDHAGFFCEQFARLAYLATAADAYNTATGLRSHASEVPGLPCRGIFGPIFPAVAPSGAAAPSVD